MKTDLEQLVYYATLAPSSHNAQPWKFRLDENTITIIPDYSRSLPVADPDNHALFIGLGCALENLVIAAKHFGLQPAIRLVPGQTITIKVKFSPTESSGHSLFSQVEARQSTRNKYDGNPIPQGHLQMLLDAANQDDVRCIILDEVQTEPVIKLVKEACMLQFSNKAFIEELAHWIRFEKSRATRKADGLSGIVSGNPWVPEWFGRMIMGITVSPEREAARCASLIRSSSAMAVFVAKNNDVPSWINVGRSFERFALTATALHINHAHENMPCEELTVREKLAKLLQLKPNEQPLLLLRLGYSEKMPHSFRRPISQVIIQPMEEILG